MPRTAPVGSHRSGLPVVLAALLITILTILPPAALAEVNAVADHLVLGEIYYDSPGTDFDCFVEIYNPTDTAVPLAGWSLVGLNGNGNTEYGTINLSGSVPAHGFYLVGQDGSVFGVVPDRVDGNANYQNGSDGLKLKGPGAVLVDYIGYGDDPDINLEGQAYFDVFPGQSIERKSGPTHDEGAGNGWDTESNIDDCRTRSTPEPQNSSSPPEIPPPPIDLNPPIFAGLTAVTDVGFGGSLLLSWSPAQDPEGSIPITYRIYRSLSSGGQNFAAPFDSTTRTSGFADNHLTNGQAYFYVVRAVDAFNNEDDNTVEQAGTPSGAPPAIEAHFGTLHTHTGLSDGVGTPDQAFTYARNVAQVDVLGIAEHTHQLSDAEYALLRTAADAHNVDGAFVAIAGQEHGTLSEFGHLNIYDALTRVPTPSGDLPSTYVFIDEHNLAASFCHPADWNGNNFDNFAYNAAADSTLGGIAIISGDGPHYESAYQYALTQGWRVGTLGDQDTHDATWGNTRNPSGDVLLSGFSIDGLTRANVLDAVIHRRTYAFEANPASDRIAFRMEAAGQPMGAEVTVPFQVPFLVEVASETAIQSMELVRNDLVVASWDDGTLAAVWSPVDTPPLGTSAYYIRLMQVDGDRLWSAPIWVTSTGQVAVANPQATAPTRLGVLATPNPFAASTAIDIDIPSGGRARVTVRNMLGRRLRTLTDSERENGRLRLTWDGRDAGGKRMPAGVYFMDIEAAGSRRIKKLVIAR